MSNAFTPRPDCPLPPIEAIGPLVVSESLCVPEQPIFEFPVYEFPPPFPPSYDFGCTAPRTKTTLKTAPHTPKFAVKVNTETDRGPCDPELDFDIEIPNCVDIRVTRQDIATVQGPPQISVAFTPREDTCGQDLDIDILVPQDPCVVLNANSQISEGFPSLVVQATQTQRSDTACDVDLDIDLVVPPCVTVGTSATMVQGNDNTGSINFVAVKNPSEPCQQNFNLDIVLPKIQSSDEVCEVQAASTKAIASLSGFQTVDRVFLNAGSKVLVKNQANRRNNGVYEIDAGGAWNRSCDLHSGIIVSVGGGGKNKGTAWMLTSADPILLGTTELDFSEVGGTCCCYAKAATTRNLSSLSGAGQTIDGVLCQIDDVVLVKNQDNASENGPYLVKDDAWDRTCNLAPGSVVHVRKGDSQALTAWILNTEDPITADTTGLLYEQLRAPGNQSVAVASVGALTLSGLQEIDGFFVNVDDKVLVKDQNVVNNLGHVQNGVYLAREGAWVRDLSGLVSGMNVTVRHGDSQSKTTWILETDPPLEIGTTPLSFVRRPDPIVVCRTTNSEGGGLPEVEPTAGELWLYRVGGGGGPSNPSGVYRRNADGSDTLLYGSDPQYLRLIVLVQEGDLAGQTMWIQTGLGVWSGFTGFLR